MPLRLQCVIVDFKTQFHLFISIVLINPTAVCGKIKSIVDVVLIVISRWLFNALFKFSFFSFKLQLKYRGAMWL